MSYLNLVFKLAKFHQKNKKKYEKILQNYKDAQSYAGPFLDVSAGYFAGIDYCWAPTGHMESATQATCVTLSTTPGASAGFDWYTDPTCLAKWGK